MQFNILTDRLSLVAKTLGVCTWCLKRVLEFVRDKQIETSYGVISILSLEDEEAGKVVTSISGTCGGGTNDEKGAQSASMNFVSTGDASEGNEV